MRGVVLDLQNCPGIELAGLQVARWLIDRPVDAGVWFGSGERDAAIAGKLAPKRIVVRSGADFAVAEAELRRVGSVAITLEPMEDGRRRLVGMPLAVLHSRRTVTSAESLAEVLHLWRREVREVGGQGKAMAERVRFIGEVTGKRPQLTREILLNAGERPTKFDSGWAVRMPVFDWRPTAVLAAAAAKGSENAQGGEGEGTKVRLAAWKGCEPDETGNREAAIAAGKAFVRRRGE